MGKFTIIQAAVPMGVPDARVACMGCVFSILLKEYRILLGGYLPTSLISPRCGSLLQILTN